MVTRTDVASVKKQKVLVCQLCFIPSGLPILAAVLLEVFRISRFLVRIFYKMGSGISDGLVVPG